MTGWWDHFFHLVKHFFNFYSNKRRNSAISWFYIFSNVNIVTPIDNDNDDNSDDFVHICNEEVSDKPYDNCSKL